MADNISIDPGTSPSVSIKSDDIGGSQVQYVKLMDGTDGGTDAIQGTALYGLEVDVVRQAALPAGTALIGKVSIDQITADANKVVISGTPTVQATHLDIRHLNGTDDVVKLGTGTADIGSVVVSDSVLPDGAAIAAKQPALGSAGSPSTDIITVQGHGSGTSLPVVLNTESSKVIGTVNIGSHAAGTTAFGAVYIAKPSRTWKRGQVAISSNTTTSIWTPSLASLRFVLKKLIVSCKTAGDIHFFDGNTDDSLHAIGPVFTQNAGGGWTENWDMDAPYESAAVNYILKATSALSWTGSVYYEGWETT